MKLQDRFWSKVNKLGKDECWEWKGALNNGYGWFHIAKKARNAHRVAAFLSGMIDQIDGDLHVLHKCDNPKCCNPHHFFLGTNQDNIADRVQKGRTVFVPKVGQANGMSKLSNSDIMFIREMYNSSGLSQSFIAKQFGVTQPQISRIVNRVRCGGVF